MKRDFRFLSFWLLLVFGLATVVFNSCGKDDDDPKNDGNNPDTSTIAVADISLDSVSLTLVVNANHTLKAKVLPANATDPTVAWSSSNTTIATVSSTGLVTALAEGTATITAQAGNQSATCGVKVIKALNDLKDPLTYDAGVVINGIKWATRNVDAFGKFAAKPEDPGKFYQWNRKTAWSATEPGAGIAIGAAGGWDNTTPAGATWEPANDPSPAGWRVPTREEQQKLSDASKVKNEWTKINGVFGRKFTDLANEDNFIFLPAVGCRSNSDGTLNNAGELGYYWSSTQDDSSNAYYLLFYEWGADWNGNSRSFGFSVRAVAE